jgi:putative mRNA 3-end processing factor
MASGWMSLRGVRRRRGFDKGFVVSDHADFPGLLTAIAASRARRVLVTHGFTDTLTRLLQDRGVDAAVLPTRFTGEASPDAAVAERDDDDDDTQDDIVDAPEEAPA